MSHRRAFEYVFAYYSYAAWALLHMRVLRIGLKLATGGIAYDTLWQHVVWPALCMLYGHIRFRGKIAQPAKRCRTEVKMCYISWKFN